MNSSSLLLFRHITKSKINASSAANEDQIWTNAYKGFYSSTLHFNNCQLNKIKNKPINFLLASGHEK